MEDETRAWFVADLLGLLVPEDCKDTQSDDQTALSIVSYIAAEEALPLEPYKVHDSFGFNIPMGREQAEAEARRQQAEHEKAVAGKTVLGYVRWFTPGSMSQKSDRRLIIEENSHHTGSRIWEGAWLHRTWALHNAALFGDRSVLELGAGCGILGLTVASACAPESVILSDFRGHFESDNTVMHLLQRNVAANVAAIPHDSVDVKVFELDWAQPREAVEWNAAVNEFPSFINSDYCTKSEYEEALHSRPRVGGRCASQPCDIILGTELIYSVEGGKLLADLLPIWLKRPHGAFYLLNNAHRTGIPEFLEACSANGLHCDKLEIERTMGATWAFGSNRVEENDYVHFKVHF